MIKKRWTLFIVLAFMSLTCAVSVWRLGAANPTSGNMSPTSPQLIWNGTAVGGTSNGEDTCVEGVNCDTFTLTVLPGGWTGKRIEVNVTWVVLAHDYDLYIHKGSDPDAPGTLIDSSAGSPPSTSETADINPSIDGTGVFTVRVVYFAATAGDQYHAVATVVTADVPPPPPPPVSPNWTINYHGECCEGNLGAEGANTHVLLPVLLTGNKIKRSDDGGQTWTKKYPPVDVSDPYGIEGDLQAFGNDVVFFGTKLYSGVAAHSNDRGENWTVVPIPVAFVANDQAWSYLGPFTNIAPVGQTQTEPYVLTGWYRIGSVALFSFDGGLTWPLQTPLVGNNGSGSVHVVCRQTAHAPTNPGDTRIPNADFANKKSGRHGCWGTDRKFYWTEPADGAQPGQRDLYVCKTNDFGVNWTGIKHPVAAGPAANYVVSQSAFDNNGTLYVLHGDKLYVSFNQGESFAFTHTLPRWGNAGRSDSGADQFFVVDCGTIHIGLLEDAGGGTGNVYYLRGAKVDTASPAWKEELVDVVGNVRLDFMQIVLDGNGIPTISYTTPDTEVTTASRIAGSSSACLLPVRAVSRKRHGPGNVIRDIDLPLIGGPGIECRKGTGLNGKDFQVVFTFAAPITGVGGVTVSSSDGLATADSPIVNNQFVTVNLHNVANEQTLIITLTGVNNGTTTGNVGLPVGILGGDTNGDRRVNVTDTNQTKSRSGQLTNDTNKRSDVTLDGRINVSDTNFVKSHSGDSIGP